MNYTNYIMNGNIIDIDSMLSKKKYLRHLTIIAGVPVALFGVAILGGCLPAAFVLDKLKITEVSVRRLGKNHERNKQFNLMIEGLTDDKDEQERVAIIFKDMKNETAR